jgi:hypothetical protein
MPEPKMPGSGSRVPGLGKRMKEKMKKIGCRGSGIGKMNIGFIRVNSWLIFFFIPNPENIFAILRKI